MDNDNAAAMEDTEEIRISPHEEFGHVQSGYAVEFEFAGFACRSLTVETESEAKVLKQQIERKEESSAAHIVRDP